MKIIIHGVLLEPSIFDEGFQLNCIDSYQVKIFRKVFKEINILGLSMPKNSNCGGWAIAK